MTVQQILVSISNNKVIANCNFHRTPIFAKKKVVGEVKKNSSRDNEILLLPKGKQGNCGRLKDSSKIT